MLINIKVKTLDAQTYEFSIDNEVTVRAFKDLIAERTTIAADQQRIIYCGRVLADEKQLKDYDVDGKVVHVAERPPPSQRGPSSSSSFPNEESTRGRPGNRGMRNSPLFRALDGMVVGTMAIPMNAGMNNAQTPVNPFTSSSSFCMNRITVARHMLNCANNIAAYLEDPERGLNNTSLDILARGRWTMESTVVEVGITAADLPQNQNIVEMVQGAVSAALRRNGNTNVTVVQLPTVFGSNEGGETPADGTQSDTMESTTSTSDAEAGSGTPTAAVVIEDVLDDEEDGGAMNASSSGAQASSATVSSSTPVSAAATEATSADDAANNSTSTGTNTDENLRRRTGTNVLGEVIEIMRTVQARLSPFIDQFYDLLTNEPTFEENDTTGPENTQRLFDRVSEALHYMSHAQHAISDLMLDISQPSPRYLTCRPILVEQSGYVSSNNYLSAAAAAAAAATQAPRQPQREAGANAAESGSPPVASSTPTATAAATSSESSANSSTDSVIVIDDPDDPPSANANVGTQSNDNHQMQMARLIQAVVNSAPIDTEFHVQINAPSIVSFGVPLNPGAAAARAQSSRNNATSTAQQEQQSPDQQPDQTPSPTENDNNNDNNLASATGTAASSPNAARLAALRAQARVHTATLPTTSTQTRSTSRPQLQIGNMPGPGWNGRFIPANMMSSFDRFLPCNSHHIREAENATNGNGNGHGAAAPHNHNIANTVNQRTMRSISDLFQRGRHTRSAAVGSTMMNMPRAANGGALRNLLSMQMPPLLTAQRSNPMTSRRANFMRRSDSLRNSESSLIRDQMQTFVDERLFARGPINEDSIPRAITRAVVWFNESLIYLPQYEKPEYDARASMSNVVRHTLPLIFDVMNLCGTMFLPRYKEICEQFIKQLFGVLEVCVGRSNAEMFWGQLMRLLLEPLRENFSRPSIEFYRDYINPNIPSNTAASVDVERFIVHRNTPPPTEADGFVTPPRQLIAQPIDTDVEMADVASSSTDTMNSESAVEEEPEPPLPDVVTSEPWHRNFPNNWLPILTRDIQTQAENQPTQAPFSDAYLSGMSAKRRKMIQSNKPHPDAHSLIADSVRKAIQTVGVTTSTASNQAQTPEEIISAIASDSSVQASYTEALRTNVRDRLKKEPDYKADKFPQTSKFVNK